MKERQTHFRIINLIISFFVVAGMFLLYRIITDFIFLTNDDMYLQSIVSGELSGTPDAHMIYSNIIWGSLLKILYQCSVRVPWYGLFLIGVCFICIWVILYRCLSVCSTLFSKVATTVFFAIVCFCAVFRHISMVQYTVVAAFAGGTAIFYAMTMDMGAEKRKIVREFIIVLFFAFLSLIIREKVFFMLVPFAACGWLGKWIADKNKSKKINRRYVFFLLSVISLMIFVCAIDRVSYKVGDDAAEWQEYIQYNNAREQIFDYYSFPDFDSNQTLYDEVGLSREAYEGISKYYFVLPQKKINSETMQIIAKRAEEIVRDSVTLKEKVTDVVKNFIQCNLNYTDRPMNIVVYAMWLCVMIMLVLSKNKSLCIQLFLLLVARMGLWVYIIWQGRYPDRITQSLYLVELVMLASVFIINRNVIDNKKVMKHIFLCVTAFIICVPSIYVGINKARDIKEDNAGKIYLGTAYLQLKDYCADNDEYLYLVDMNSVTHFKSSVFSTVQGESGVCDNLIPFGSWPNKSPLITETLLKYNINDVVSELVNNEKIYFVFKDLESQQSQYVVDFFDSEMSPVKTKLEQEEVLHTEAGVDFVFYRLKVVE